MPSEFAILGCLVGTAVGDALGLPYEGLSPRRAKRLFGPPDRMRFLFGKGMVSDDTEHTCMVAQSLLESGDDVELFCDRFSWRLRWWLLGLPAGIGLATLRSILKLWIGFSPENSGVFSAGNGPAMRAAIFGATFDDPKIMASFVQTSAQMTHTDIKAEIGATAVAIAASISRSDKQPSMDRIPVDLRALYGESASEFNALLAKVRHSLERGQSTADFAVEMGLGRGISGYIYHTVPLALHAWLRHPTDYRQAVQSIIACGGDTDTTAAIVGGIVGCRVGQPGIPSEWIDQLAEWPRSLAWMRTLSSKLARAIESPLTEPQERKRAPRLPVWGIVARNLLFLLVVLFHGLRRFLPPY